MTAIIDEKHDTINCPHCTGKIKLDIEKPPAVVQLRDTGKLPTTELEALTGKINELEKELRKPKEAPKADERPKKPTIKAPPHIKKGKCKNCGELHDNENYQGKARGHCNNCGAIFSDRSDGKCPFCKPGEIDELTDEEIENMQLYADDEEEGLEHDHE